MISNIKQKQYRISNNLIQNQISNKGRNQIPNRKSNTKPIKKPNIKLLKSEYKIVNIRYKKSNTKWQEKYQISNAIFETNGLP